MSISLNTIVDVDVEVTSPASISSDFTIGLIIGNTVISSQDKLKVYSYETYQKDMVADGFATTSPEYKAAVLYFSQNPRPAQVAIGVVGDNTPVQAITAFRAANETFYSVCFCYKLQDSDVKAVAAAVEGFAIPTMFYYFTDSADVLTASTTNLIGGIKALSYNRSVGFYSSAVDILPAFVGLVSALCSLNPNSSYTAAYKTLIGVTADAITNTQLNALISYGGNCYTNFGNRYSFTYPGVVASGLHIDEIFLLDAAKFVIQQQTVAGMVGTRKVPMTEDGMSLLTSFISSACDRLFTAGFIASGIWTGDNVLALNTGDAIENGYYIQAGRVSDLSAADRASRNSPPIYVCLLASGAIEHVVIRVFVNR